MKRPYPSFEEIEAADHEQIATWYRFLSSPINEEESRKIQRITQKLNDFGGFNPELSKRIGWQE